MKTEYLYPAATLIVSWQNNSAINYKVVATELIDNAFDWHAHQVKIDCNQSVDTLTCHSDSIGCSVLSKIFRAGQIEEVDRGVSPRRDRLGRYGIGLKEVSAWFGDVLEVQSCDEAGDTLFAIAPWGDMILNSNWGFINLSEDRLIPTDKAFFLVTIRKLRPGRMKKWDREKLADYLSQIYRPALATGRHIILDGQKLKPIPLPELSAKVEIESRWNQKRFRLTAGKLPREIKHVAEGYTIAYGARIIRIGERSAGLGDFPAYRFFGYLELMDDEQKWQLSKFKDSVEDLADFLDNEVYPWVQDILTSLETEERDFKIAEAVSNLEDYFNEESAAKAKRKKRESKEESQTAKGTDAQHQDAANKQEADKGKMKMGGEGKLFAIKIDPVQRDGNTLVQVYKTTGRTLRVEIDLNHLLGRVILDQNHTAGVQAIASHIAAYLLALEQHERNQLKMPFMYDTDEEDPWQYFLEIFNRLIQRSLKYNPVVKNGN